MSEENSKRSCFGVFEYFCCCYCCFSPRESHPNESEPLLSNKQSPLPHSPQTGKTSEDTAINGVASVLNNQNDATTAETTAETTPTKAKATKAEAPKAEAPKAEALKAEAPKATKAETNKTKLN